jgi:hypothetical protein
MKVPALLAVGWEGIFGMCIMSLVCIIFFFIPGNRAGDRLENINDAMIQVLYSHFEHSFGCIIHTL